MKLYKFILPSLAVMALAACSDDKSDWTPGPDFDVENQIFFKSGSFTGQEVEAGATATYDFTIARENSSGAISVPIVIAGDGFDGPSEVDFADGDAEASFSISFTAPEVACNRSCTITIPEGKFNSPYTSMVNSAQIDVLVLVWDLITDQLNMSSYYHPETFPAFTAKLYRLGSMDTYRIEGFMDEEDFIFDIKDTDAIMPRGGLYGADPWDWGYKAWAFTDEGFSADFGLVWPGCDKYELWYPFVLVDKAGGMYSYVTSNRCTGYIYIAYSCYDLDAEDYTNDFYYDYVKFSY